MSEGAPGGGEVVRPPSLFEELDSMDPILADLLGPVAATPAETPAGHGHGQPAAPTSPGPEGTGYGRAPENDAPTGSGGYWGDESSGSARVGPSAEPTDGSHDTGTTKRPEIEITLPDASIRHTLDEERTDAHTSDWRALLHLDPADLPPLATDTGTSRSGESARGPSHASESKPTIPRSPRHAAPDEPELLRSATPEPVVPPSRPHRRPSSPPTPPRSPRRSRPPTPPPGPPPTPSGGESGSSSGRGRRPPIIDRLEHEARGAAGTRRGRIIEMIRKHPKAIILAGTTAVAAAGYVYEGFKSGDFATPLDMVNNAWDFVKNMFPGGDNGSDSAEPPSTPVEPPAETPEPSAPTEPGPTTPPEATPSPEPTQEPGASSTPGPSETQTPAPSPEPSPTTEPSDAPEPQPSPDPNSDENGMGEAPAEEPGEETPAEEPGPENGHESDETPEQSETIQREIGEWNPETGEGSVWHTVENYSNDLGLELSDQELHDAVERALERDNVGGDNATMAERWEAAKSLQPDHKVTLSPDLFESISSNAPEAKPGHILTGELGSFDGTTNPDTGLLNGTGMNSVAEAAAEYAAAHDMPIDVSELMQDSDFRTALYELTDKSLTASGETWQSAHNLQPGDRLNIPESALESFLEKVADITDQEFNPDADQPPSEPETPGERPTPPEAENPSQQLEMFLDEVLGDKNPDHWAANLSDQDLRTLYEGVDGITLGEIQAENIDEVEDLPIPENEAGQERFRENLEKFLEEKTGIGLSNYEIALLLTIIFGTATVNLRGHLPRPGGRHRRAPRGTHRRRGLRGYVFGP